VKIKDMQKWLSTGELIQKSNCKSKDKENPEKERRQKPGCHMSQPCTTPELFPLRVLRRLGSSSPLPTDGHRTTLNNLAMGSSKGSTVLHNFSFPANHKKIVEKTEQGHITASRKRYSSSLIRANLTSRLTPYSAHERN